MKRTFGKSPRDGQDGYAITLSATCDHALDDIWAALTKPNRLARWLSPVTGNLARGGRYEIAETAGGKIEVCEPKRRLSLTLKQGELKQQLEVTFNTEGKGKSKCARISLAVRANKGELPEGVWDAYGPATIAIGWEIVMAALLRHLDAPKEEPSAGYIASFAASAAGREFTHDAFTAWRKAAISGGENAAIMATPTSNALLFYNGLSV